MRLSLVLALSTLGATPALAAPSTLRKGPYLQDLGPDSVEVRVELDPPVTTGKIEVEVSGPDGPARRFGVTGEAAGRLTFGGAAVTGLKPKTAYRYRLLFSEGATKDLPLPGAEGTFTSAPSPGEDAPLTFLLYGDNRSDDAAHAGVIRAMSTVPSDFLLHTGDFVESGEKELEWQRFFEIERDLLRSRTVFGAVGNHELTQPSGENFLRYFGEAGASARPADRRRFFRTLRWGTLRVFFLNGMDTFTSTEERKWLEGELAKSAAESGISFRIAVLHHGPYSSGPHGPNARLWNSGMVDILRENRVDLVFSGHDHIYERGDAKGFKYVISGGGGAPLYPIRKRQPSTRVGESVHHFVEVKIAGQELAMVARRVDGSILDRCGFAKGGPWNCDKQAAEVSSQTQSPIAPPPSPPATSRCGCDVPGRPTGAASASLGLAALGLGLVVVRGRSDRVRRRASSDR